jgi:hypothetical protein
MRCTALAGLVAGILLAGCSTDSRSIRFDNTTGALPASSVPDAIKSEVADKIYTLQGGAPTVRELRVSQPFKDILFPGYEVVEVSARIPATISIGETPAKCYKVMFSGGRAQAIKPAELNGCSGGMEDMLAFYQSKYPS